MSHHPNDHKESPRNVEEKRVERYCDDCKSLLDVSDTCKCGECKDKDKWEAKEAR